MRYYAASMKGIMGLVFRSAHRRYLSGVDKYYFPFIAPNQNQSFSLRKQWDIPPENNEGVRLVPQILTDRSEDFVKATLDAKALGYEEVNLNLGCPSRTTVTKGRGPGFLAGREKLCQFLDKAYTRLDMKISVKTRIGRDSEEEWPELLELYNRFPMEGSIVHPRIQQDYYKSVPRWEAFGGTLEDNRSPVCYNGGVLTVGDFEELTAAFPEVEAVILGREPIANPRLVRMLVGTGGEEGGMNEKADIAENWAEAACKKRLRAFHDEIYTGYEGYLSGDKDVLFRMKRLWFYLSCLFEHSGSYLKEIRESSHGSEYRAVVDGLFLKQPLTVRAGFKPQGRNGIETRKEVIAFYEKLVGVCEDYPFHDDNWTMMRHRDTKKTFAYIFEKNGHIWINVKYDTEWRDFWRVAFLSVVPGFHLNKTYWNSIILGGNVPEKDIRRIITKSCDSAEKK